MIPVFRVSLVFQAPRLSSLSRDVNKGCSLQTGSGEGVSVYSRV